MVEELNRRLDFDSDTFEQMKQDMNFVLQRLLGNMVEKDATEGSMTIKIDVSMESENIPNFDPNIEGDTRNCRKPQFKHKVSSVVKINDEKTGELNNEMELFYNEETGIYELRPVANTAQRSIFDADFQEAEMADDDKLIPMKSDEQEYEQPMAIEDKGEEPIDLPFSDDDEEDGDDEG